MRKSTLFFWIYVVILILSVRIANAQQLNLVLRSSQDASIQDSQFMAVGWDSKSTFIPAPPAPPGNNFYMYIDGTYRFKDIKLFSEGKEYQWDFAFNLPTNESVYTIYLNKEHISSSTDYVLLLDQDGAVVENLTYASELHLTADMKGKFSLRVLPKGTLETPIRLVESSITKEIRGNSQETLKLNTLFATPNLAETSFTISEVTNSNITYSFKDQEVVIDWASTNADNVSFKIDATNEYGSESVIINYKRSVVTSLDDENTLVNAIGLNQNYPNPFNPTTAISFNLPQATQVNLSVYNMAGQQVATLINGVQTAGETTVQFNASTLPSGVYIYRLVTAGTVLSKKMTLIK